MTGPVTKEEPVMAAIGRAVVEWSKVEKNWAHIFRDLLFYEMGERSRRDEETGGYLGPVDEEIKNDRADAVFFATSNGGAQRRLIRVVAGVVLEVRPDLLESLKALLAETAKLAEVRNTIVHAYYEVGFQQTPTGFKFLPHASRTMGKFKKAHEVDLRAAIAEFNSLNHKVADLWMQIIGLA